MSDRVKADDYVEACGLIVDIIRAEGADTYAFTRHSYAAPTCKDYPLPAWYPVDAYVE